MKNALLLGLEPIVYLITKGDLTPDNFLEKKLETLKIIRAAIETNISLIQIREKKLHTRQIFELASEAVELAENTKTKVLINERADVALAAKADGVHLTSKAMPTEMIRKKFPKDFIIGVSTHSLEKAFQAKSEGADFATFSPIFPTASKAKYGAPQGTEKLKEVCEKLGDFPIIALGGIDKTNYKTVLANGASGFAAIRFLSDLENLNYLSEKQ